MKKRILITKHKDGTCTVQLFGKIETAEYADILAGAYAGAVVDTMKSYNLTNEEMANLASYALRENIASRRKRGNK